MNDDFRKVEGVVSKTSMKKFKLIVILFFHLLCVNTLHAQKKSCPFRIEVDLDNNVFPTDKENLLTDTLPKKIELLFEQSFDNIVEIWINDKWVATRKIKTHKTLGVADSTFDIDYSTFNNPPRISIFLQGKTKHGCVSFYPKEGKQIAYVTRIQNAWSIKLSNLIRQYR